MVYYKDIPYNDLKPLPPSEDVSTRPILEKVITASRVLAALKALCNQLPDPGILVRTIPHLEAQTSSEIEKVMTTTDKLLMYEAGAIEVDAHTKEAWQYTEALREGYQLIEKRPLGVQAALRICSVIRGFDVDVRTTPGTRIAVTKGGRVETLYTPPEGKDVILKLLNNWERYVNEERSPDPLIRLAVMHYQFEAIHPFSDGNGRTGRILNILYLIQENLLEIPVLYLSRYFLQSQDGYYEGLRGVTEKSAWEPWILYMLDAVEQTATLTRDKILEITGLQIYTEALMKERAPKIYSRELLDVMFKFPYLRIANVMEHVDVSRPTATGYLKKLVEVGLLSELARGRHKFFINDRYVELLNLDRAAR